MEHLRTEIERLSEAVVFLDRSDRDGVRGIIDICTEMLPWCKEAGLEEQYQLLELYISVLSSVELPEESVFDSFEIFVNSLQSHVIHGREASELPWPKPAEGGITTALSQLQLPENVDDELFSEYLKIQPPVLDKIDEYLLELERGENPSIQAELCRTLHTLKGESGLMGLVEIERVCHQLETELEEIPVHLNPTLYFSCLDWLRSVISFYRGEEGSAPEAFDFDYYTRDRNCGDKAEIQEVVQHRTNIVQDTLQIDATRVDRLIDSIGELVVAESMVRESDEIKQWGSELLRSHIQQISKITRELQSLGMGMRMVPIRGVFKKMSRLVRDLSKKHSKDITLVVRGEDTEIDKQVADQLGDPLIHMVRNAVDHGIEDSPEKRRAQGKNATATITLHAYHRGGSIIVEVSDDGRGLDSAKILEKAREQGIFLSENLSEKQIYNLIFEPGFSTAQEITDISGRGVGMDVVRQTVENLHGSIDIVSQKGQGTCFTISLPLTLAIIDGLLVRSGNETYIIPALNVVTSLCPSPDDIYSVTGKEQVLRFQQGLIPVRALSSLFSILSDQPNSESIVVVVEDNGKKVGVMVEELLGKQQVVIKKLGYDFNSQGILGGAIMGDGTVGLIIDTVSLIERVLQ